MLSLIIYIESVKDLWILKANNFLEFLMQTFITILFSIVAFIGIMFEMQYILIEILIGLIIFIIYLIYKEIEEK